jgi:hypothetical protein
MPINTESSSAGLTSITAVAALWNPRLSPGSSLKTILDAQFFLGQEDCESLIGALSYFNSQKLNFGTTPSLYLINTTVSLLISLPFSGLLLIQTRLQDLKIVHPFVRTISPRQSMSFLETFNG